MPIAAVTLVAACGSATDPSEKRIRERASHAQVGLDARLTPLMRQQEVIADWRADYCVDDPFTTAEWDCFATRNIAISTPDLRAGAQAVDTELTRLGCHPQGDPELMGLTVMLDNQADLEPAHALPTVQFRCGEDSIFIQPSDASDPRLATIQRPDAWPEEATGGAGSRMLGGGTITEEDANRLRSTGEDFMLATAMRNYHSE